jgi:hypothetical protein
MLSRPFFLLTVIATGCVYPYAHAQNPPQTSNSTHSSHRPAQPDSQQESNVYRNSAVGFRYNVIIGWVDRTREMQPEEKPEDAAHQGKVLLAVFERPPEVQSDVINSGVVIAQESAASYPGLKAAADYVAPLTQLAVRQGFKADGDPSEVTIDARTLVQCDFKRVDDKRVAYQSTLILLQKATILSFTFIGASHNEVEDLIDRLSFQRGLSSKPK